MFIDLLLFLLFMLIVWWLYRKFRYAWQEVTPSSEPKVLEPQQTRRASLSKLQSGYAGEDDENEDEVTRRAVSFEPDGSFKIGGKSSPESVHAYAAKIQRAPGTGSSVAAGEIAKTTLTDPEIDTDEWRNIASTEVVSDEEREFVASLLRQIDENNRDITALSVRARDNDKLREEVSELQSTLEEREQVLARLTGMPQGADSVAPDAHSIDHELVASRDVDNDISAGEKKQAEISQLKSNVQALNQQLLVRDQELAQLKSNLLTAQKKARDAKQNTAKQNRPVEAEQSQLQKTEKALAASQSRLVQLGEALAAAETRAATSEYNDLELRRVRSELQVLQQQQQATELQLGERNQRVVELEALVEGYVNGDDQSDKSSPARTFASGAVASAAARAASRSTDPKAQTAILRQLYQPPEELDDLKLIKGIGLKMEQLLNQLGVTTFRQLASFETKDIEDVSAALKAFPGRIQRDNWVGQAAKLQQQYYGDNVSV